MKKGICYLLIFLLFFGAGTLPKGLREQNCTTESRIMWEFYAERFLLSARGFFRGIYGGILWNLMHFFLLEFFMIFEVVSVVFSRNIFQMKNECCR